MSPRRPVQSSTVEAVAAENAGHPLDAERARQYAAALEPLLAMITSLRDRPLKDIEPAITFEPIRGSGDD